MEEVKSEEKRGNFSASMMPRLMRCPGSYRLTKGLPNKKTKESVSGDKIHLFLAHEFSYDDLSKSEQKTADIILYQEGQLVDKYSFESAEQIREKRLWTPDGEVSGRLDANYLQKTRSLIIDYKTGYLTVSDIKQNEQILCECLLVAVNYNVSEVTGCLIHPLDPQEGLQEATFSESELVKFQSAMYGTIEIAKEPDAPLIPGEVQCKYCAARDICPAVISQTVVVTSTFGVPVSTLTPDQRGDLASKLERAEKLIKSYKEQIKECLKDDPAAVSGWRLGSTGSSMKVVDEDAIREALASGLSGSNLARCFKFNKTEAIEATAEAFSLSEAKAKEQVDKLIRPYVRFEKKEKKLERIRKTETKEIENEQG